MSVDQWNNHYLDMLTFVLFKRKLKQNIEFAQDLDCKKDIQKYYIPRRM